jgi:hypothetical protein
LAEVLEYTQYRNFEAVIEKAKLACFNSGHRIEDHFADVSKMIEIGKGGRREVKVTLLSRYACYLVIQNADPGKEIVAHGQTYLAIQTRRQELADEQIEEERHLILREEIRQHNVQLADAAKGAGVVEPRNRDQTAQATRQGRGARKGERRVIGPSIGREKASLEMRRCFDQEWSCGIDVLTVTWGRDMILSVEEPCYDRRNPLGIPAVRG